MPGHKDHALLDEIVGNLDRLFRIALVVADFQFQLLAEDTALGIDILDGHLRSALQLFTESGILAGHRTSNSDSQIFRLGSRYGAKRANSQNGGQRRRADQIFKHRSLA